jgi:hypothetical protein
MFSICSQRVKRIERIEILFSTGLWDRELRARRDGARRRTRLQVDRDIAATGTKTISGA